MMHYIGEFLVENTFEKVAHLVGVANTKRQILESGLSLLEPEELVKVGGLSATSGKLSRDNNASGPPG